MTCRKCKKNLEYPALSNQVYTHYCYECKECLLCKELISPLDLNFCLKHNIEEFKHTLCMTPELLAELESKSITVGDRELELLNIAHLMVNPNIELSIDTNCKEAELYGMKWFSELPTLDEKFLALRRLETLAATCSLLLKKDPNSKTIKIKLDVESSKRFKAASKQDVRHIPCTKCGQKFPELEISTHFKDCLGKTPKTQAKAEKVKRTKFEQAVDLYMKYGMTAGEAKKVTEEQFKAQGMEVTYSE